TGPAFDAQGLGDGDLYMVDMGGIPHRLEQGIGEAQSHQILHRFLAEIVIDAIDAMLGENMADRIIDGSCPMEVAPQWLVDHKARLLRDELMFSQPLADGPEKIRTDGQIEDANAIAARCEEFCQIIPTRFLACIGRDKVKPVEKPGDNLRLEERL